MGCAGLEGELSFVDFRRGEFWGEAAGGWGWRVGRMGVFLFLGEGKGWGGVVYGVWGGCQKVYLKEMAKFSLIWNLLLSLSK